MKLNLFSKQPTPEEDPAATAVAEPRTGRTFPADEVVWGIVVRNGFDELDDPLYHRGRTQHAYLEGNDNVAICGFRPPQSGPRTRRRARLGMPTIGQHPMCGMCARMVVAPRPKVAVPVRPSGPRVSVPIVPGTPAPMPTPSPALVSGRSDQPAPPMVEPVDAGDTHAGPATAGGSTEPGAPDPPPGR